MGANQESETSPPFDSVETKKNGHISKCPHAKGRLITQVSASTAAALGSFSAGTVTGWTASTLPSLLADPDIVMGTSETAWISSIISLGCVVGSIVAGKIMDFCGRRGTLMIIAPIIVTGWLTIGFATNTTIILLGRLICGITTAFLFTTPPVYCSEVPEARLRGRMGLLSSLFISFGVMYSYVVGAFFPWRTSCYICTAPVVLMVTALCVVPESPYWYLLKGRKENCKAALKWLRGPAYDISEEMAEMEVKMNSVGKKAEYRELLRPRTRKPFMISLFVNILQQMCGTHILLIYAGLIFISAGVEDHRMATVYMGLVQIVFTIICMFTVDHLGRKVLIAASTAIIGVATITLGVYYLLKDVLDIMWPPWVPLASILIAVAGYCLGCRSIPFLLAAELFNTVIRSTANTASIFCNRTILLIIIQVYPFFEKAFGAHTVFLTFGCLSLTFSFLALFIVPETKGKTLEEIQAYFESSKKNGSDINRNDEHDVCVTHL